MYRTKKRQIIYSLVFTFILILTAVTSFQLGIASVPASGTFYLDAPFSDAQAYVMQYDNDSAYAIRGTDWKEMYGSSDSILTIQNALNNLLTSGRTWKEKLVIVGNYSLSNRILVPSYTHLDLTNAMFTLEDNSNPTPIIRPADRYYYTMLTSANSTDVIIEGGSFRGNGDNQNIQRTWANVYFQNVTNGKILYTNSYDSCWNVNKSAPFYHRAYCFGIMDSTDILIDGVYGEHSGYEVLGIRFNNIGVTVQNSRFDDGYVHTIQVANGGGTENHNINIGNNIITQTASGYTTTDVLVIHSGQNVTIHDNKIIGINSQNAVVRLLGTSNDIWIESNKIVHYDDNSACILLGEIPSPADNLQDIHILHNEIETYSTGASAIASYTAGTTVRDIDIIGNDISINGEYAHGIYVATISVSGFNIKDNEIICSANFGRPITVLSSMNNSQIIGNTLQSTMTVASVYLTDTTQTKIILNKITGNWGIYTTGNSDYNLITQNNVFDVPTETQRISTTGNHTVVKDNLGLDPDWISPYQHYLPLMYRVDAEGLIYYNDPYIVIRLHNETNHWISWLAFGKTFGYGKYEWKAYAENNETNSYLYLGGLEYRHGWFNEGIICLRWTGTEYVFSTTWSGGETATSVNDIDFTVEKTIMINWTSSYVEYYIDGILKANHTTNVPQQPMQLFAEVGIGASAPTTEPTVYFRNRSFKEIG